MPSIVFPAALSFTTITGGGLPSPFIAFFFKYSFAEMGAAFFTGTGEELTVVFSFLTGTAFLLQLYIKVNKANTAV